MNQAIDEEKFNIVGLVINLNPEQQQSIEITLKSMNGIDICASEQGKLVITIDVLECNLTLVDTITEINNLSGVVATSIAYHYFEGGLDGKEKQK